MSLRPLVAALGGDLYANATRANIPAPGHSAADRSISLVLDRGRVVIHGFGGTDWREARDHLRASGFIDDAGRLTGPGRSGPPSPRPDRRLRLEIACRLWADARGLDGASPADRYLERRAIRSAGTASNLGFHGHAPVSVYRAGGAGRLALIARISDAADLLTAVELTYLHPNGHRATDLHLSRKTVGLVPPGAAVRLRAAEPEMLVGEGVVTTLSAIDRFQLPGWALRSANNLAAWTPPPNVQRVLVAADRGPAGQGAAWRLRARLVSHGLFVRVLWPDPPFEDWNEVATAAVQSEEEGR